METSKGDEKQYNVDADDDDFIDLNTSPDDDDDDFIDLNTSPDDDDDDDD